MQCGFVIRSLVFNCAPLTFVNVHTKVTIATSCYYKNRRGDLGVTIEVSQVIHPTCGRTCDYKTMMSVWPELFVVCN